MRRGIAADAPLSDAGEERLSEEDRRALKMIEELFPGEYRAAKREVAAAIASDAPSSLGGLAAILSQRGNPDGAVLAGRIVEALLTDKATLMDASATARWSTYGDGAARKHNMRYSRNRRVWYHCRSGKEPGDGFRRDAGNEPQKRKKPQTAVS